MSTVWKRVAVAVAAAGVLAVPMLARADDWSDLRAAIYNKRTEQVVRLLDRGVDVNMQNDEGWTPLMIAAEQDDGPMVQYLLSRGADPAIRNRSGRRALDVTSSSQIKTLLGAKPAAPAPAAPKTAAVKPAARPVAPAKAEAKPKDAATAVHCKTMYSKSYTLCDRSDYGCKIKATNDYQTCLKRGSWY